MNTLHLHYVIEIEKAGSITKAADNLYMGQPNLSKAIRELEASLGFVIFRRTPKGVVPTEKGSLLIRQARSILSQVRKLESLADSSAGDELSVCFYAPQSTYLADAWLALSHKINKKETPELRYRVSGPLKAINRVAERQSSLSLIRYQTIHEPYYLDYLAQKDIAHIAIWTFTEKIIVPVRSPLAAKDLVEYTDLEGFLEIDPDHEQKPSLLNNPDYSPSRIKQTRLIRNGDLWLQFELLSAHADAFMLSHPLSARWLKRYDLKQKQLANTPKQFKDILIYPNDSSFSQIGHQLIREIQIAKSDIETNLS